MVSNLAFSKLSLPTVQLVRRYKRDEQIRRRQFDLEDSLKQIFPQPPEVFTVREGTPPEQPRFRFRAGKMTLTVNELFANFSFNFEDGLPTDKTIVELIEKHGGHLDKVFDKILSYQAAYYAAIQLTHHWVYPGDQKDVGRLISARLLKIPYPETSIESCNAIFGLDEAGVYRTFDFAGYKFFKVSAAPGTTQIHIDADFDEGSESGLQLNLEVNSKGLRNDPKGPHSFLSLLPHLRGAAKDVPKLIGTSMASAFGA